MENDAIQEKNKAGGVVAFAIGFETYAECGLGRCGSMGQLSAASADASFSGRYFRCCMVSAA